MFYILFVPFTAFTWILFFEYLPWLFGPQMKRLIIPGRQSTKTSKKEYLLSVLNLLVFTGFGALLDFLKSAELTKFYFEIEFTWTGLLYLPASLFISLFIHDLFFYLSHRLFDKGVLRATFSGLFFIEGLARITTFAVSGLLLHRELLSAYLAAVPITLGALWVGSHVHTRLTQAQMLRLISLILLGSGVALWFKALSGIA